MFAVSAAFLLWGACALPAEDEVGLLPGFGKPSWPLYSGFLKGANATNGGLANLHYVFAAAETEKWESKPVVLWLNGGPGSSSMLGFFQEQGPYLMTKSGRLLANPWAWTKVANLLAIEAPGGVGFSYCESEQCEWDDKTTATANAAAVRDFLGKFPELAKAPLFITGESYAGVYCPTLAAELLFDGNSRVNLVGMAVGDPCTDNDAQRESMDMIWYSHKNGFLPDKEFNLLYNECGKRAPSRLSKGFWGQEAALEEEAVLPDKCLIAERKYLLSTSRGISQSWDRAYINDLTLFGDSALVRFDVPGSLNYAMSTWMNSVEVRAALHITREQQEWPGPGKGWSYTSSYAACSPIERDESNPSMIDFYRKLAPNLPGSIIVFNGDTDPCVSYEGTRTAMEQLGFEVTSAYRPWFFNASEATIEFLEAKDVLFGPGLATQPAGPQLAGHVVDYAENIHFVTVHGSGHMVPQFRPQAALTMITHLIANQSLAPPLPTDSELAKMSAGDFDKFQDKWTDLAQAPPFLL